MELSILVISRTYYFLNRLIDSINEKSYIDNNDFEILCSWNGESQDLKKIHNPKNYNLKIIKIKPYNFASNMNKLISISIGKYLLIINDDVILDKGSISEGLNLLKENINIGLVGGNLRDRENKLTHAGVNFNILNSAYHFLENLINHDNSFVNNNFIISASTGALMITRREIFNKVRFNELYEVCGEDIELCLDIKELLGKEIFYCNKFKGIHEAESTRKRFPKQQKSILDKRRLKKRYCLYLKNLEITELLRLYNFDKKILNLIFESDIQTYKGRIQTDYWFIIILNLVKLKIILYIKKLRIILNRRT